METTQVPACSIADSGDFAVPALPVKRKVGRPRKTIPPHLTEGHPKAEQERRDNIEGPACSIADSGDVTVPALPVKRKVGRPRKTIPPHLTEGHPKAEQERRDNIEGQASSIPDSGDVTVPALFVKRKVGRPRKAEQKRRDVIEDPSPSILDSVDVTVPEEPLKRKVGRPRNPIPRYLREGHKKAEQKRRDNIETGMKQLKELLVKEQRMPHKKNEAEYLSSAVTYIKDTETVNALQKAELDALREEAAATTACITSLKSQVDGDHGNGRLVPWQENNEGPIFQAGLFRYMAIPLEESFMRTTDGGTRADFQATVQAWTQYLDLDRLRPMFNQRLEELYEPEPFVDIDMNLDMDRFNDILNDTSLDLDGPMQPFVDIDMNLDMDRFNDMLNDTMGMEYDK